MVGQRSRSRVFRLDVKCKYCTSIREISCWIHTLHLCKERNVELLKLIFYVKEKTKKNPVNVLKVIFRYVYLTFTDQCYDIWN